MSNQALKRILNKDIKSIEKNNLNDLGIYVEFNEKNLFQAYALIKGPKDSLYNCGYLFFNIEFPKNYPYAPPDVSYLSCTKTRIHPNIYVGGHKNGGKVCLSILGTWNGPKWTTVMDISTILITIQSLLDNNPLCHEPGFSNPKNRNNSKLYSNYNEIISYETINSLCMKNIKNIPGNFKCFENIIKDDFKKNFDEIIQKLENKKLKNKFPFKITIPYYRNNVIIDYHLLHEKLLNINL
tara:strand:- start:627 stop:1343 length:717 start_codon:yes stop_codon:yes gene_type:complete